MTAPPVLTAPSSPAPSFVTARLRIKSQGALTSTEFQLGGERLTLGRFDEVSGPVDIDLTGLPGCETVSRLHAELFWNRGAWHIKDLGSTNGVFVKRQAEGSFGPRLLAPIRLGAGDEVALGNTRLVLVEATAGAQEL
ncbi:FHA domain-containing protein [Anthocerotibacter panamensis]|uniref:FHA domain-containing protein n=1 Tax=Anthocerotibacter panamensis TaxID=2857077 RepID=UPI001C406415|nr:FHA domain-containing protein [Anthocerotibacter panamensis]